MQDSRVDPHKNLGVLYEKKGDRAKAIESYEVAIKRGHPDKEALQRSIGRLK
jgi:hypothetical protein